MNGNCKLSCKLDFLGAAKPLKRFGGLTRNRTGVHGFAGLSGFRRFNDLAAKWADFRPNEIKGLPADCKLSDGPFWCWPGAGRAQASAAGEAAPMAGIESELAGALAPASKKPHPLYEAPAVGPITIRSLRGAAGVIARESVQGFVTAPIPRALRPDLVRALAAPDPSETEFAGGLAPASKKPRLFLEAPAVGPITVEACVARRGAVHPETDVQGFVTAPIPRALRPDLVRALAACLRGAARPQVATSIHCMEPTR